MAITKPPVRQAWADNAIAPTDIRDPGAPYVAAGWLQSTTPPSRQIFNWLINFCFNAVRYFSRRGVVDYDAAETYLIGDIVRGDDGILHQSLANTNIGNTPSTSPLFWGSLSGYTTPATLAAALAPYATAGTIQGSITSIQLPFTGINGAGYYKIATLPISVASTCDSIRIIGTLNTGFAASGSTMVDILMGNRSGFAYQWNNFGPVSSGCGIYAVRQADGSVDVYAGGNPFAYAYLSIVNVGNTNGLLATGPTPTIFPSPVFSPSTPGARVFDSTLPGTYPPLLSATSPSTYSTAQQIAATYATQALAAANLIAAETFATNAANAAAGAAEAYADGVGANVTAATELYAGAVATNAQANAQTFATAGDSAVTAAFTAADSTVLTNAKAYTDSKPIIKTGSFNCANGTVSVNFATAFPNACSAVHIQWEYTAPTVGYIPSPAARTKTGFQYTNASAGACTYIAVGS